MLPTIEYRELLPGHIGFFCHSLNATLSPKACAMNFTKGCYFGCTGCPIGENHARAAAERDGVAYEVHSIVPVCTRCRRGCGRVIGRLLCMSCSNRQRETLQGKNGKGQFPVVTAERLRRAYAVLAGVELSLRKSMYGERQCTVSRSFGLRLDAIGAGSFWLEAVVTDLEELRRLIPRLFPMATVIATELGSSLAEEWTRRAAKKAAA